MFPCLPWKREEKKWRSQAVHEETRFSYDYFMNNNASSSQRYVILRSYVMLLSLIPSGTQHQRLEPIAWSDVRDTNQIRGLAYRLSYHRHAWRGDGLFKEERGATKKGVGRNKTYVWKWQGGGEHLDSTEHIALLFIQQPFTIKLTYRYPNTNTRTHARIQNIQAYNKTATKWRQLSRSSRWPSIEVFEGKNYKAGPEIQPIPFKPTLSEKHSALIKNRFF